MRVTMMIAIAVGLWSTPTLADSRFDVALLLGSTETTNEDGVLRFKRATTCQARARVDTGPARFTSLQRSRCRRSRTARTNRPLRAAPPRCARARRSATSRSGERARAHWCGERDPSVASVAGTVSGLGQAFREALIIQFDCRIVCTIKAGKTRPGRVSIRQLSPAPASRQDSHGPCNARRSPPTPPHYARVRARGPASRRGDRRRRRRARARLGTRSTQSYVSR